MASWLFARSQKPASAGVVVVCAKSKARDAGVVVVCAKSKARLGGRVNPYGLRILSRRACRAFWACKRLNSSSSGSFCQGSPISSRLKVASISLFV